VSGAPSDEHVTTQVLDLGGQAVARGSYLPEVLDRGTEAVARGAVPCASQVRDRGAEAVIRGAARCASHVLDRGAQAGSQTVVCGGATLPQQEKNTWQMIRTAGQIFSASSAKSQGSPRGDVPSKS
jgi:hypothetical protein